MLIENGSAFIVVIVVLVAIIAVSCSAIIYLLREEGTPGTRAARRRRYNAQPLVDGDLPSPRQSKKWYSSFWASRDRYNHVQLDKPTTMMGHRRQGWTQANNRDWNTDSADERALQFPEGTQSIPLRMSEQELSGSSVVQPWAVYTPRVHSPTSDSASSIRYDPNAVHGLPYPELYGNTDSTDERALPFPEGTQSIPLRMSEQKSSGSSMVQPWAVYTPRVHSLTSDGASSIRYDPHAVHGLPYPELSVLSPQPTILSLQSQLHSPTSSSSSSPVPRRIMRSPEPIANTSSQGSSHDSIRDSLPQPVPPVLHTLGSGTKFFESL